MQEGRTDWIASLSDRHREAARLRAQGLTYREISERVGFLPHYWSRLATQSPRFRAYLDACRSALETYYLHATEQFIQDAVERRIEGSLSRRSPYRKKNQEQSK